MNRSPSYGALIFTLFWFVTTASRAEEPFRGIESNLSNLYRTATAQSRSISAENRTGEPSKGGMATDGPARAAARDLGQGWKISPRVQVAAHSTCTLAQITGSGAIQQIWMTAGPILKTRMFILRFYWDDEKEPSIECPMGDFFACGWGRYCQVSSIAVCVNPRNGFNCYWLMPFRKAARITLENLDDEPMTCYYQINYALGDVPEDAAYFHAQFRRQNPLLVKGLYPILDGVEGVGQYVGTYLAWAPHSTGWWGEGEIKFYVDGDKEFPTICGTGTEDYFCGANDFNVPGPDGRPHCVEFTTPYSGLPQVISPDGLLDSQSRFGMYRWHITDPIRFRRGLKVTMQALGWQSGGRYLRLQDDIASVAFWYQQEPHKKFPALPSREELELH